MLDNVGFSEPRTHQYEWAGLDLEGAVLSKRLIKPLVQAGMVSGWDDPRLATIAAYRRRGVPPEALRLLAEVVGVSRAPARTEEAKLDFAIREVLNPVAPRVMAVLEPLKVVITNYPSGASEVIDAPYFPRDVPREGSRPLPFSGELWIERSDFEESPPPGFRRLVPGGDVRLRHAYVIRCDEVVKNAAGAVVELRCSYDPATRSGAEGHTAGAKAGGKTKGTIHWVDARSAVKVEVRLFGHLFAGDSEPAIDENGVLINARLNPDSLTVLQGAWVESSVVHDPLETRYQFERNGYFWRDPVDSKPDALVFNRIVTLRDTWTAKVRDGVVLGDSAVARVTHPAKTRTAKAALESKSSSEPPRLSEAREDARRSDPELAGRMSRYQQQLGLSREEADILTGSRALSDFFEQALTVHSAAADVAAWVVNELPRAAPDTDVQALKIEGRQLGQLVALVGGGKLARLPAKEVLAEMVASGADASEIVRRRGLDRVETDDALLPLIEAVLSELPDKVREYQSGKTGLLGFFVGQVVRRTEGRGDPVRVKAMLVERLESADGARR